MSRVEHWPSFLRELDAAEQLWKTRDVRYSREDAVPWMPFPLPQFVTLLTEAVSAAARPRAVTSPAGKVTFLDVGCGPGTKCRLARAMFNLADAGIDIVPRFVAEAQQYDVRAWVQDAFELGEGEPDHGLGSGLLPGYANFDIVLVNRPSALQDKLEMLVMERMASDAVLIAVNWRNDPGRHGWIPHYQEFGEPVCGVWIKP